MSATKKAIDWHFDLPLTTEKELRLFVEKAWGATIPDVQVCPNHSTPWRAFCDAYFAKSPVTVWHASRGFGGKSFLLALLGLTEAVTLKCDVNILGGSGEQSKRVLEYSQEFWDHEGAPKYLLASDVMRETRLAWGNKIQALMASSKSVRGPHVPRLRFDEGDETDIKILDAAMGQPMEKDGVAAQTVISSTHHYADGTFTEVLKRAAEKGWPVHTWCYHETSAAPTGWLSEAEIERKRSEITAVMFSVEFDLNEPAPESRAIQPDKVKAMFKKKLGVFKGRPGEYIEIEGPKWYCRRHPQRQHDRPGNCKCKRKLKKARYATGADWARKKDWTVILTFRTDVTPACLVAFERCHRLPWPVMVGKFEKQIERYDSTAEHDGTGLGDVVAGYLTKKANAFIMVGRARSDLLSDYISDIEDGAIEAPFIEFMESNHRLASVDDVYGKGHLPDDIAAGALAWRAGKVKWWVR
jgi:hypothetical protein